MNIFYQIIFSILGGASFAITFRVPKRFFIPAVALAVFARFGLSFLASETQVGMVTFIVAFFIGLISHILARLTGAPSQAFLIPGVIFLVPGIYIYRAFDSALRDRITETIQYGVTVVSIAAGISFALLLANWIMPTKKLL